MLAVLLDVGGQLVEGKTSANGWNSSGASACAGAAFFDKGDT